jgi:hypothetical protein
MPSNTHYFQVYTTRLLDCDIIRCIFFVQEYKDYNLALLSCALLLPRAIVLRANDLRAFVTARCCLRGFVGAVLSCALLSGHPIFVVIGRIPDKGGNHKISCLNYEIKILKSQFENFKIQIQNFCS